MKVHCNNPFPDYRIKVEWQVLRTEKFYSKPDINIGTANNNVNI